MYGGTITSPASKKGGSRNKWQRNIKVVGGKISNFYLGQSIIVADRTNVISYYWKCNL